MTEAVTVTPSDIIATTPSARDEALGKIASLKADAEWTQRYLKGGSEELAQMKSLHQQAYHPGGNAEPSYEENARRQHAEAWRDHADLPDEVIDQVKSRQTVSAAEYKAAVQTKQRLLADREWTQKYMNGDRAARREMSLVSIILGSRIKG
jgi:hypothetical protein